MAVLTFNTRKHTCINLAMLTTENTISVCDYIHDQLSIVFGMKHEIILAKHFANNDGSFHVRLVGDKDKLKTFFQKCVIVNQLSVSIVGE
jgi:ribosomal protein L10